MKKSVLSLVCILLIGSAFWQLRTAPNSFDWLVATNAKFDILRVSLGVGLLGYAFIPRLQTTQMRLVIRALGVVVFLLALRGLYYLTYVDSHGLNMYPLDVVSLLEAGIITMLASLSTYHVHEEEAVVSVLYSEQQQIASVIGQLDTGSTKTAKTYQGSQSQITSETR